MNRESWLRKSAIFVPKQLPIYQTIGKYIQITILINIDRLKNRSIEWGSGEQFLWGKCGLLGVCATLHQGGLAAPTAKLC